MAAIREFDAKLLLAYWLQRAPPLDPASTEPTSKFVLPSVKVAQIQWDPDTGAITPDAKLPGWISSTKLVAKPDQLIKRLESGLLILNKDWEQTKVWIAEHAGKPQKVCLKFLLSFHSPPLHPISMSVNGHFVIIPRRVMHVTNLQTPFLHRSNP